MVIHMESVRALTMFMYLSAGITVLLSDHDFTVQPESLIEAEGNMGMFECLSPGAQSHHWGIDGFFPPDDSFPHDLTRLPSMGNIPARLYVPTTWQYNNTLIQCEAIFREGRIGSYELSQNATLKIQGPLYPVTDLVLNQSSSTTITISWSPPFSLNLTTAEPDIQYCVDVYNVTGGGDDHLQSVCDITDTYYTFTASDPDQLFNFTVTSRSNVEGSLNGTTSQPVQGYVLGEPVIIDSSEPANITIISITMNSMVTTNPSKSSEDGSIITLGIASALVVVLLVSVVLVAVTAVWKYKKTRKRVEKMESPRSYYKENKPSCEMTSHISSELSVSYASVNPMNPSHDQPPEDPERVQYSIDETKLVHAVSCSEDIHDPWEVESLPTTPTPSSLHLACNVTQQALTRARDDHDDSRSEDEGADEYSSNVEVSKPSVQEASLERNGAEIPQALTTNSFSNVSSNDDRKSKFDFTVSRISPNVDNVVFHKKNNDEYSFNTRPQAVTYRTSLLHSLRVYDNFNVPIKNKLRALCYYSREYSVRIEDVYQKQMEKCSSGANEEMPPSDNNLPTLAHDEYQKRMSGINKELDGEVENIPVHVPIEKKFIAAKDVEIGSSVGAESQTTHNTQDTQDGTGFYNQTMELICHLKLSHADTLYGSLHWGYVMLVLLMTALLDSSLNGSAAFTNSSECKTESRSKVTLERCFFCLALAKIFNFRSTKVWSFKGICLVEHGCIFQPGGEDTIHLALVGASGELQIYDSAVAVLVCYLFTLKLGNLIAVMAAVGIPTVGAREVLLQLRRIVTQDVTQLRTAVSELCPNSRTPTC